MSLINDALKRARATPPPLPTLDTKPPAMQPVVERERKPTPLWPVFLLPVGLVLVFLLAGWFLWRGLQARRNAAAATASPPAEKVVVAREQALSLPPLPRSEPAAAPDPATEPVPSAPSAASGTSPAAANPDKPVVGGPIQANAGTVSSPGAATGTGTVAPQPPTSSKFMTLKLQGICYRPSNPSVMINNKTLFLGESIGEVKVTAITRTNVALECNGESHVLILP